MNQPLRTVIPFFEEAKLEYKMNYLFDNQYVDYYVPSKKTIYIADNSIYMSLDLVIYIYINFIGIIQWISLFQWLDLVSYLQKIWSKGSENQCMEMDVVK